ncbi:sugar ABC transporter ATP-binding protein [Streptomyces sp. WMMC500]|uniref:sugar ABC transporter ATP-binding protein n=1 Tax=Streptomyces sp. WMMC500 TaxID=3015154 RepID=UPI00248AA52B|nr:sugar ABC transporter ATP-binding protein [Streptomyces sp. WMMC500]WBB58322.1 sugar ABC transporter ATP-binding protein [Streptomyces sp. WMMC500]
MHVALDRIGKSYGGTPVLHDVSLSLRAGRVHGLVGENGAGKSTLARVLCGAARADRGRVLVDGREIRIRGPRDALGAGIVLVTQEGTVVPGLSVLDNVLLGTPSRRYGLRDGAAERRRYGELVARTGWGDPAGRDGGGAEGAGSYGAVAGSTEADTTEAGTTQADTAEAGAKDASTQGADTAAPYAARAPDPYTRAGDLPFPARQQVEFLRALAHDARLVVLDEPTAALAEADAARLLATVRRLAADAGIAFVLISHRLDEVIATCDTVTVLRDGRRVTTVPAAGTTPQDLLRDMVGTPVATLYPEPAPVPADAPVVLAVRGLSRGRTVRDVSLEVRAGEIVGLAGLAGSGRTETLRAVFGADRRDGGEVTVGGRRVTGVTGAMALGAGLIPASRADQGLVLVRSTAENLALASLADRRRLGFVRRDAERRTTGAAADQLDIRGAGLDRPAWTLSGGNQQKSLFGKWLIRRPRLLLADEPTRGVDVAARTQIHRLLAESAAEGVAVLVASSDIDEVLGLAHRVLVMREGRVAGEFARGTADARDVLALAGLR